MYVYYAKKIMHVIYFKQNPGLKVLRQMRLKTCLI